jgi:hypothetical protein
MPLAALTIAGVQEATNGDEERQRRTATKNGSGGMLDSTALKRSFRYGLSAAVLGAAVLAPPAGAQDPTDMINCISLARVDRTEVVDDNTILFYMRSGEIYRNVLSHRCPGLGREETFMYRVTTSQLCNVDVITVLDRVGAGFMPGASCGHGNFNPIIEAAVEELKAAAERSGNDG